MAVIAVVDDDEGLRRALSSLVRSLGLEVEAYGSATDFLIDGLRHQPSCLLLDVEMPGMSGPELCDELVSRGHRIPVIFMTAGPIDALRRRVLAGQALDVLRKPCGGDLIEDGIARALLISESGRDPVK